MLFIEDHLQLPCPESTEAKCYGEIAVFKERYILDSLAADLIK